MGKLTTGMTLMAVMTQKLFKFSPVIVAIVHQDLLLSFKVDVLTKANIQKHNILYFTVIVEFHGCH